MRRNSMQSEVVVTVSWRRVVAQTVPGAAEIIDDDFDTVRSKEGVLLPQAPVVAT